MLMFNLPPPDLQVGFALLMKQIRESLLQDALNETVRKLIIPELDRELAVYVSSESLSILAGQGLRAELLFPVPILLLANPRLLAYYRLLYGYSQKEFYTKRTGFSAFKTMEERGFISAQNTESLDALCAALCGAGQSLLLGIGGMRLSRPILDELTVLTLGPQLRGGANVKRGAAGIRVVFKIIQEIVAASATKSSEKRIEVMNAAGRKVLIEFAADPDIIIREKMSTEYRELVAMEVKAGADFSNIHNRLGEAEKSHQKARRAGYVECWTVVNVDPFNARTAAHDSPSTDRFYRISDLLKTDSLEHQDFRDRILSSTGIKDITKTLRSPS
jgi:hypothetical protein